MLLLARHGGFPTFHSCFKDRQKLRRCPQTFADLTLKSAIPLRLCHPENGGSKTKSIFAVTEVGNIA